jgi:hypothetical protein
MLAALEHIDDGATSNNLTKAIMGIVHAISRRECDEIAPHMVCFDAGMCCSSSLFCILYVQDNFDVDEF